MYIFFFVVSLNFSSVNLGSLQNILPPLLPPLHLIQNISQRKASLAITFNNISNFKLLKFPKAKATLWQVHYLDGLWFFLSQSRSGLNLFNLNWSLKLSQYKSQQGVLLGLIADSHQLLVSSILLCAHVYDRVESLIISQLGLVRRKISRSSVTERNRCMIL